MTGEMFVDQILAHAARRPDGIAVRQWGVEVTYRDLVDRASTIAVELRRLGVGPESMVAVCGQRDPEVIIGILGILLAGGAYVPVDLAQPPARREKVLADGGMRVAVVNASGAAALEGKGLDLVRVPPAPTGATPPPRRILPDNAAYVLYTSGSTGTPKGVAVTHGCATQYMNLMISSLEMDETVVAAGFAALGFDVSVFDILGILACGGCVAFVPDGDRIDPARLQHFLEAHEVTWVFLGPALLPLLDPDRMTSMRQVMTGGEPCGPEQVARWSAPPHRRFYNWYGPTETTICVVSCELAGVHERSVPIGLPLDGVDAYIVDEDLRLCPDGVPGELVVGGPQVGRGYVNRPALTAERYVPDPFSGRTGSRLYRTGDLVVRNAENGMIDYLGRLDRQVKIAGQRVELGEVESVLRLHPGVTHAAADVLHGANGHGELVAYLSPSTAPDLVELREYCGERLPAYMTPTRVVRVETLPMNVSGKVDLRALRAMAAEGDQERAGSDAQHQPPRTPIEQAIAGAWGRVLGVAEPSLADDFFACGGQSILAMRLVAALRADLGRTVTVEDVFDGRTLGGLAARVEKADVRGDTITGGQPATMSPAQRRVWFVEKLARDTPAYNIALSERLRGPLDPDALASAWRAVLVRHDVLRWRFPEADGVPYVVVDPVPDEVALPIVDLSGSPQAERPALVRQLLAEEATTRFDLARDRLWRVRLLRLADDEHVLAVTVHHNLFDGWSVEVLYRDLASAYKSALAGSTPDLGSLPATYADYAGWLRERDARHSAGDVAWWVEGLTGVPPVVDLPRDRPRPPVQTFRGAAAFAQLAAGDAVRELAARLGTTGYAVLLAGFGQVLRRLTGQRDLIVGAPVADRGHPDFEPMIGFCVDTVPLRLTVDDDAGFAAHVRACAETLTAALARAETPLERIVSGLGVERDLSRNPLVQVLFNMYNFAQPKLTLPGVVTEPIPAGLPGSLFDLTLYISEDTDGYALQAVYNPDLFDAERIDAFLAGYAHLVTDLALHPDRPVGAATMRPPGTDLPDPTRPLPSWTGPGVLERLAEITAADPDRIAVSGPGHQLSYRDLGDLRRAATAAIRAAGLTPGTAVAVLATRHPYLPGLLLGVLAAGARWAVLDTSLPPARLAAAAHAAGCHALLACPDAVIPTELAHLPVITVTHGDGTAGDGGPGADLAGSDGLGGVGQDDPVPAEARGYISFTSGTTGQPKAILAGERPLAHFLHWYADGMRLRPADRFALLGGLGHDPVLRDMFTPLSLGATLCVPPGDLARDPVRLAAWLAGEQITVLHATPQLLRLLVGVPAVTLPHLRLVASGGDQLTHADTAEIQRIAPAARLVNLYGTTETPQAQAFHPVPAAPVHASGPVPVGKGIDGTELHILGPAGQPAGIGELGEVVIRSRYLADGYLDAGQLDHRHTTARFRPTPQHRDEEDRMYTTGDLGRYHPNGEVTLTGRTDDQVKIRGYRLEPSEIEAAIVGHPEVKAAAVITDTDTDQTILRAYAVPTSNDLTLDALREHLTQQLPPYAIPTTLTLLPALPLTANGKLDRAALPRPATAPADHTADEPVTPTERLIAGVWREVLALPRIGTTSNFFEIGGHSMAIVTVQTRLNTLLGRDIDIVDLFRFPNIRGLAAHLDGNTHRPGLDRAAQRVAARRDRTRRKTTDNPAATHQEGRQ